jgi:hypothetical protein
MTYIGDDKGRFFDILVDGQVLATQELKGEQLVSFMIYLIH